MRHGQKNQISLGTDTISYSKRYLVLTKK
jgi:hypothetical protein